VIFPRHEPLYRHDSNEGTHKDCGRAKGWALEEANRLQIDGPEPAGSFARLRRDAPCASQAGSSLCSEKRGELHFETKRERRRRIKRETKNRRTLLLKALSGYCYPPPTSLDRLVVRISPVRFRAVAPVIPKSTINFRLVYKKQWVGAYPDLPASIRCKACENPRSEAYIQVRRSDEGRA